MVSHLGLEAGLGFCAEARVLARYSPVEGKGVPEPPHHAGDAALLLARLTRGLRPSLISCDLLLCLLCQFQGHCHPQRERKSGRLCLRLPTHSGSLGMHLSCTLLWMLGTEGGPGRDKAHSMERLASQPRVQRSGEGFLSREKAKNDDPEAGACPGSQSRAVGISG